jgi:FMN phosphatase YigB (HAD superfamily)
MAIFIDIGSTLVGGGSKSPVDNIINELHLSTNDKPFLETFLYTKKFVSSVEVACEVHKRCAIIGESERRFLDDLWREQRDCVYWLPGAEELLRDLCRLPTVAFVSNIWTPFYQGFFSLLGELEPRLSKHAPWLRCTSLDLGTRKPSLMFYQKAMEVANKAWSAQSHVDLKPNDFMMIGDSFKNDMAPAMALGMRTVWVQESQKAPQEGYGAFPYMTVSCLKDLRLRKGAQFFEAY